MSYISFYNVGFTFDDENWIHKNLNFTIDQDKVTVLLGPSGTGKTVILKMILGLLIRSSGDIFLEGKDVEDDFDVVRSKVAMLFQGSALFDSISVYENIAFPIREGGVKNEIEIYKTVTRLLRDVGLDGYHDRFPGGLSGGQKKRISLARALSKNPEYLLFDEPTTGLDPSSKLKIDGLITSLRDNKKIGSLVITHDMDSAKRIADHVILVADGCVVLDLPAAEAFRNPIIIDFLEGGMAFSKIKLG